MTRDELRNSLSRPYTRDGWLSVVEDVFPHVSLLRTPQSIPVGHSQIKSFVQLGTVRLADERNLALFEVEVADSVDVARNRVALRNCIASLIDQETNHGVLGIFNTGGGDYRFTFAARESYFTDHGEFIERQTAPKRYTYLLGQSEVCTTAAQRFDELRSKRDQATLSDVIDAFSVERLNKDFYTMIRGHFARLSSHSDPHSGGSKDKAESRADTDLLVLPGAANANPVIRQEFSVRLIGRILFAWFLKRKFVSPAGKSADADSGSPRKGDALRPLIPDYLLSSDAIGEVDNYYHDILEKLFFQILNQPENERSKYLPKGAHLIPYLNGGLFEPHEHDFYAEGAIGTSKFVGSLVIPDQWFREFFLGLEQYNFTIDENTVADNDVSIDPEILGCIFENLLAEINPETGESARKATGSFYTPREIVDYMVEESLLAYLEGEVGKSNAGKTFLQKGCSPHPSPKTLEHSSAEGTATACVIAGTPRASDYASEERGVRDRRRQRLELADSSDPVPAGERQLATPRQGVRGTESPASSALRRLFDEAVETTDLPQDVCRAVVVALGRIKVLDPACGSGAFPVGMLQKMLCVLRKVDPDNDMWLDAQFDRVKHLKLSKTDEDKWLAEIEHAFETNAADYGRKLGIIQNSIYGVDIQPIATEIAKLRFFLTLVVDENIDDTEPNRGILPLPNLDFKFVCANTLVHAPRLPDADADNVLGLIYQDTFFADFANASRDYFYARNPREKCDLRQKIEDLVGGQVHAHMKQIMSLTFHKNEKFRKELETKYAKRLAPLTRDGNLWQSYANLFRDKTVGFFDPKYMFPDAADGFDIVIGNPPYVRADSNPEHVAFRKELMNTGGYETLWEKWDLYVAFLERGYKLLRQNGVISMIISDAYSHAKYAQKSQQWFLENSRILRLDFLSNLKIFEAAVHNDIVFYQRADGDDNIPDRRVHHDLFGQVEKLPSGVQKNLTFRTFFPEPSGGVPFSFTTPILNLSEICYVTVGMVVHADEKVALGAFRMEDLVSELKDDRHPKAFVEGKHLDRWLPATNKWLEWGTDRAPRLFRRPTFPEMYEVPEKILVQRSPGPDPKSCYDAQLLHFTESTVAFIPWHFLCGVRNRSIQKSARYAGEKKRSDLPAREDLEAISERFSVKYLLAIMNSNFAREFLRANRRSNIHLYPDDWKKLPIPDVDLEKQTPLIALVDKILALKSADPNADVTPWEQEIDAIVEGLWRVKT